LSLLSLRVFIIIFERSETFYFTVFARKIRGMLTHIMNVCEEMAIVLVIHTINTYCQVASFTEVRDWPVGVAGAANSLSQLSSVDIIPAMVRCDITLGDNAEKFVISLKIFGCMMIVNWGLAKVAMALRYVEADTLLNTKSA